MKISIDHVTNSSSESFGTAITDTIVSIALGIPFIAATLGIADTGKGDESGAQPAPVAAPYASSDPADPPGTTIQDNADGSKTKTLPDGTVGTKRPDGYVYVSCPDGATGVITPDGREFMFRPDGSTAAMDDDGTEVVIGADGTAVSERIVTDDGSTEISADGRIRTTRRDTDDEVVIHPDGSATMTLVGSDGSLTACSARTDGSLEMMTQDNGKITFSPDGGLVITGSAGETRAFSAADIETMFKTQTGGLGS